MKDADAIQGSEGPFFEFRLIDNRMAYLRMPTWAFYNTKWNWKAFLTESFAALVKSGATDLVLDVRGNEGGQDCRRRDRQSSHHGRGASPSRHAPGAVSQGTR